MNHTWKKNTCSRCHIERRGIGKQTLYSATLYDTSSFDEGEAVDCWVGKRPDCYEPVILDVSGARQINIAAMGEYAPVPGFCGEVVFGMGSVSLGEIAAPDVEAFNAGKPVPFSRVGAPDHVHAPRVPDGVTR